MSSEGSAIDFKHPPILRSTDEAMENALANFATARSFYPALAGFK